ncbi:MAG: PEP-CTERM sorting domain-containing protein [Rhodocyclaceae bacterium]|nr:PEP-CTERM sorting domain-containing protein [Rhodocyclaceae bacterium]MBX3670691.1 PEP-CTERM sorting domain-containing protein [Rhodocyclaceae bacterium]
MRQSLVFITLAISAMSAHAAPILVPEPSEYGLLGIALAAAIAVGVKKRK